MGFGQLTDVVKNLIIINVIMFFAVQMIPGSWSEYLILRFPGTSGFSPVQIVSHMFMHADMSHLFFNMFGLFIFGPIVEGKIGMQKFFKMYFIAGLGAMILQLGVVYIEAKNAGYELADLYQYGMIGASGALMGVVAAFATLFPNMRVQLLFPPIPLKAKYMALGYIAIDLFGAFGNSGSNVAHFAHIGGALFGFLFIRYFGKDDFRIN